MAENNNAEREKLMKELSGFYETFQKTFETKLAETQRINEEVHQFLRNQLDYVLKSVSDGVVAVDLDGKVTAFNSMAEQLLCLKAEEIVGQDYHSAFGKLPAAGKALETVLAGGERILRREVEWSNGGGNRRIVSIGVAPIRNQKDKMIGAVETFTDMTELKELEEHLERKNRLEALGEMAAGVAHEIRNPLGAIELYAALLRKQVSANAEQEELISKILSAVSGLNRIVEDMLAFTRTVSLRMANSSIVPMVSAGLSMAQPGIFEKKINVEMNLGEFKHDDLKIYADAEMMKRVFLNIMRNAVDAMAEGGKLGVFAKADMVDGRRFVCVAISDNGCGIDEAIRDKIFNPFFTGKRTGTGLGLPIAHRIIEAHGGKINFTSITGQGTTFEIRLPAVDEKTGA